MARITFENKIALEEQGSIAEVNKITADNINEIKTAINSLENDFLPLTGGTLRGDLSFSHTDGSNDGHITWTQGTYWQRLKVVDSSSSAATLFAFQRSSDGGETFNNIATLSNDGIFTATKLSGEVLTTKITGDTVTFSGAVKVTSGLTASTINGYTLKNACSKTTRTASSITHSGWANLDTDSQYVPDMALIAYWNGAYNSNGNSNLQYCDRGRFGTMAVQSTSDFERNYHWTAQTYGGHWCHICHVDCATNVEGMAGILHVTCTRGNVVGNATFLITASHSQQGYITQLGSNTYSSFAIRAVANAAGSCYIDLYDNMTNASGTYQNWHCCFIPLRSGGITTYSSYTNGDTIPSGYRSDHHLQSWTGGGGAIQARHIAKQGQNVPATFIQSSTPTATQTGDIWFS